MSWSCLGRPRCSVVTVIEAQQYPLTEEPTYKLTGAKLTSTAPKDEWKPK